MSIDLNTMYWEPMWGSTPKKRVDPIMELNAIFDLLTFVNVKPANADLVLDLNGNKMLRIKTFMFHEPYRDMYDYKFYGPLVFSYGKVHIRELQTLGSRKAYILTSADELVGKIKKDVGAVLKQFPPEKPAKETKTKMKISEPNVPDTITMVKIMPTGVYEQ